jgi:hypothetical protein
MDKYKIMFIIRFFNTVFQIEMYELDVWVVEEITQKVFVDK